MAKDSKKANEKDLLAQIAVLQEQLAAATSGTAVAQLEVEKAALVGERDRAVANFVHIQQHVANLEAGLLAATDERTKLAEALEAAQLQTRDLQSAGAGPAASIEPPALIINGPAISVRTKPGRQQTRYRAGRAFGPVAVPLALDDLTANELEALKRDPELVITDHDHKTGQEA